MKKTRPILHLSAILLACMMLCGLGSCGTTRAHFGLDHDVAYNWNGGYFEDGGHSHKHKHKQPKPPKHKKHKKHKEHHHH
ncbi:MAG: hypothetical protein K2J05_03825 [Muribaculaceae bacterium]|nr:hypothetical protein [Muribaculaceae bacterium]